MLTLAAFVVVLGVLVFVHELGHFLAAKSVGIAVPRFSIGFGPQTPFRFTRGETEYQLAWIPLGGFVKMASAEEQAMAALEGDDDLTHYPPNRLFENKPLWARILVISAGVIMNFLFAWVVYTGLLSLRGKTEDPTTTIAGVTEALPAVASELEQLPFGTRIVAIDDEEVNSREDIMDRILPPVSDRIVFELEMPSSNGATTERRVLEIANLDSESRAGIVSALLPAWESRVGFLDPSMPAAKAGLERGDLIVGIGEAEIRSWHDLVAAVETNAGVELDFEVERNGTVQQFAITPAATTVPAADDTEREVGRIGISPLIEPIRIEYGLLGAAGQGAREVVKNVEQILLTLKGMIFGHISAKELGGPILIGQVSGQVARLGLEPLLLFMALLSVNLAVLNLLPIPVLDGGHLVFLFLEGITRKPVAPRIRNRLTQVGLAMLLALMVFAFVNDVVRLING